MLSNSALSVAAVPVMPQSFGNYKIIKPNITSFSSKMIVIIKTQDKLNRNGNVPYQPKEPNLEKEVLVAN